MNDHEDGHKVNRVSSASVELKQEELVGYDSGWFRRSPLVRIDYQDVTAVDRDDSDESELLVRGQNGTALRIVTSSEQEASQLLSKLRERVFQGAIRETEERIPLDGIAQQVEEIVEHVEEAAPDLARFLLRQAVLHHASDVHLKPVHDGLRINYRIDGFFHTVAEIPEGVSDQFMSRIKVMSRLTTYERHSTQEGRMSMEVNGHERHFRVCIMPTISGEKGVIRVFDVLRDVRELDELEFSDNVLNRYRSLIDRPQGTVLVAGPSSSGKTTTLYASLRNIHRRKGDSVNIVSIEDPVEYNMELWNQIQVNQTRGLSFAEALSSALRMDPNVIMVGEIRDSETAEIATKAALSGHLIFSTVHSGTAPGVFNRLFDLGIEKHLVTSAVNGALAQRLVRKICDRCRETYTPEPDVLDELEVRDELSGVELQHGTGCSDCHHTGYQERTTITELLVMDEEMKEVLLDEPDTEAIASAARRSGMNTLKEDGLSKVKQGITTVEELARVL